MIWLTVLNAGQGLADGNMYFLSNDAAFGDPLLPALGDEARRLGVEHLRHFTSIENILDELATVAVPPDPVGELAETELVNARIHAYLQSGYLGLELVDWYPGANAGVMRDELEILPRDDDSLACRVGTTTIVAFTRIWRVTRTFRPAKNGPAGGERTVQFTIQMSLPAFYERGVLAYVGVPSVGGVLGEDSPALPTRLGASTDSDSIPTE